MGGNDLEKGQAGEVLQLHLLRKYVIPGKMLGPSHPYLIILKPGKVYIVSSIEEMRKVRLREVI